MRKFLKPTYDPPVLRVAQERDPDRRVGLARAPEPEGAHVAGSGQVLAAEDLFREEYQ